MKLYTPKVYSFFRFGGVVLGGFAPLREIFPTSRK